MSVIAPPQIAGIQDRPIREALQTACYALGFEAALVAESVEGGMRCLWYEGVAIAAIVEGQLLPEAASVGLDEHSMPVIAPSGHVVGELRWIGAPGNPPLDEPALRSLGLCAQVIAEKADPRPEAPGPHGMPHETHATIASVMTLVASLADRGAYSPEESSRSIHLAEETARELGIEGEPLVEVSEAATLHDVGKLAIPPEVISKRGPLTRQEARALHQHPLMGAEIVGSIANLAHLAPIVRATRERFDGSGYPDGLGGEEIPLASRIIYACDGYVAMITDRPYRRALTSGMAESIIAHNAGSQYCPVVAEALLEVLDREATRALRRPQPTSSPRTVEHPAAVPVPRYLRPRPEPTPPETTAPRNPREPSKNGMPNGAKAPAPPDPRSSTGGSSPPGEPPARSGPREAWARGRTPVRAARIAYSFAAIFGLILGLIIALPINSAEGQCPPPGEGRTGCLLQKVWLHEITIVALVIFATLFVVHFLVFKLPDLSRRAGTGDLFKKERPPPFPKDPRLVAATWGWSYESKEPGRVRSGTEWHHGPDAPN